MIRRARLVGSRVIVVVSDDARQPSSHANPLLGQLPADFFWAGAAEEIGRGFTESFLG